MNYRTFVCTTELKRRAANYSETCARVRGGGSNFDLYCFKTNSLPTLEPAMSLFDKHAVIALEP